MKEIIFQKETYIVDVLVDGLRVKLLRLLALDNDYNEIEIAAGAEKFDKIEKHLNEIVICSECSGEGSIDVLDYCGKPMSDCCGGCYRPQTCIECEGTGFNKYFLEQ